MSMQEYLSSSHAASPTILGNVIAHLVADYT